MLTVKVVTEEGINIYQADNIHYQIHQNKSLHDFMKRTENQCFPQAGGFFEYVGLYDTPKEQSVPIDFIEVNICESKTLLIGKPANVFIMNENGKTVEKINLNSF